MIHVVAVITAKPGQRDKILEAYRANRPAVLAEEGCIEYTATVDAAGMPASRGTFGPDTFVVVEKWATLAEENEDRCYHSTAVLLPDGRVLSAGGGEYNPNGQPIQHKDVHTSAQIFNPPYLYRGARPRIEEAPDQADYCSKFSVRFSGATPVRATIVKPGSVTHSMETNQRFVDLEFNITGQQQAAVTLPASPADCPPGLYMLFLLSTDGVPSVLRRKSM